MGSLKTPKEFLKTQKFFVKQEKTRKSPPKKKHPPM
jgi:hypothetical protein